MVMHRSLDRDSVTFDNNHHLAAMTSFARIGASAAPPRDVGAELLKEAEVLVPILQSFLNGSREEGVVSQLREHLPHARDAVRQILGELDHAYIHGLKRDESVDHTEWFVIGVHMEAVLFALFPERWDSAKLGVGEWGDSDVLRNNVYWSLDGLQRAITLCDVWKDVRGKVNGGA